MSFHPSGTDQPPATPHFHHDVGDHWLVMDKDARLEGRFIFVATATAFAQSKRHLLHDMTKDIIPVPLDPRVSFARVAPDEHAAYLPAALCPALALARGHRRYDQLIGATFEPNCVADTIRSECDYPADVRWTMHQPSIRPDPPFALALDRPKSHCYKVA